MAGEVKDDATVNFTVKELLNEQTDLLRGIDRKVDGKADKTDLIPIQTQLLEHHGRLSSIEQKNVEDGILREMRKSSRRRVWTFVTAVAVPLLVAVIIVLL